MDKTSVFINRAKNIHGAKYTYEKTIYVHSMQKVIITCPVHGDFFVTPNSHITTSKSGCQRCSKKHHYNTQEFIEEAKKIHGSKYDYSEVNYINNHTLVMIVCPTHGKFYIRPAVHTTRNCPAGCQQCGRKNCGAYHKKDTMWFIEKAQKIHGRKYNYFYIDYKRYHDKVEIICPEHGSFLQTAGSHIHNKNGCPQCSYKDYEGGYGIKRFENHPEIKTNPAILYLILAENNEEQFIKIGITTKTIKERFEINNHLPYQYTIKSELKGKLYDLFLKEQYLKKQFKKHKYRPKIKFNGHTECFITEVLPLFLEYINKEKEYL